MNSKAFTMLERARITRRDFEALAERDPRTGFTAPYESYRLLIDGRWHLVERQHQFGRPVYFARPIVVVLEAET